MIHLPLSLGQAYLFTLCGAFATLAAVTWLRAKGLTTPLQGRKLMHICTGQSESLHSAAGLHTEPLECTIQRWSFAHGACLVRLLPDGRMTQAPCTFCAGFSIRGRRC